MVGDHVNRPVSSGGSMSTKWNKTSLVSSMLEWDLSLRVQKATTCFAVKH